ncbi:HCCA isomerase/glutathione S-transferase kappa [Hyaloscypha bicolor E]|uniref:Glutathione S-transferase kappa n=1 Tax=Hyaloscypha bicolor E TaxID=1095630 RepID=A0A2J6TQG0_9HELO|nr:HCCA isomerase/glutathione S-transferase kappa [Hyaloscypha bicolor E]PMD65251.1 HCCA isomerase/glutathione S-transferase kappa [Hyaloscypha bicolor E]
MPGPRLTLYVDTVSPFAYEAYYILRNDPVFKKCEIIYVPIFLGGVMKACGNTPPIKVKNKDKWIDVERVRWARLFSIPMDEKTLDGFPPLTLLIMRTLCALTILYPGSQGQGKLMKALDALYPAYWVEHKKTNEREVLAEILGKVLGEEDAGKAMKMAGKEGKELLGENTDRALADGAFGLPWFVATNGEGKTETFWGVDHFGQVTAHLGLEKPKMGGWKAML